MLKTLYALAIALLVVAFVGFGISAFYPKSELTVGIPAAPNGLSDPPARGTSAPQTFSPTPISFNARPSTPQNRAQRQVDSVAYRYNYGTLYGVAVPLGGWR